MHEPLEHDKYKDNLKINTNFRPFKAYGCFGTFV